MNWKRVVYRPSISPDKILQCFPPAYYDLIWFVTRTRHSRSSLLDRIFITGLFTARALGSSKKPSVHCPLIITKISIVSEALCTLRMLCLFCTNQRIRPRIRAHFITKNIAHQRNAKSRLARIRIVIFYAVVFNKRHQRRQPAQAVSADLIHKLCLTSAASRCPTGKAGHFRIRRTCPFRPVRQTQATRRAHFSARVRLLSYGRLPESTSS